MSAKQDFDFENWYDILIDHIRGLGYNGRVDRDSCKEDYEKGQTPENAATILFKELTN